MKKSMFLFMVALAIAIGLAGCAGGAKKLNRLALGMTKQEVIQAIGNPDSTKASEGSEFLIYELTGAARGGGGGCAGWTAASLLTLGITGGKAAHECAGDKGEYFVRLVDNAVVSYGEVGDFDSTKDPTSTININKKLEISE